MPTASPTHPGRAASTPAAAVAVAAVPVALEPAAIARARTRIRRLIWLYVFLWLVEGALRKWILPGLANPLLVVRDPVLLLIYFLAVGKKGLLPTQPLVFAFLGLGVVSVAVTLVATSTPPVVAAFGFRANFLHLPLVFLLPRVLDRADVVRVGRWLLLAAGPMAVIVLGQFVAPAGSWLNAGAGGGLDGQLESAMGHVRASGTFSFTNGLVGFTALVSAFFLYRVLYPRVYPRWLWLGSGGALVVMTTLSGNRSLVGVVGLTLAALVLVCVLRPAFLAASLKILVLVALVMVALGSFAVFRQGLDVFAYRFGDEQNVRTGFFERYLTSVTIAPAVWRRAETHPAGLGLGLGTNAGAGLLTGGKRDMLLAESEWDRMVLEMGPFLGLLYLGLRVGLTVHVGHRAWKSLRGRGEGDPLALLLFAGCFSDLLFGQFAQPTALGFTCIAGGLVLAATRTPAPGVVGGGDAVIENDVASPTKPVRKAAPVPGPAAPRRGRSAYAERLHNPPAAGNPKPDIRNPKPSEPSS